MDLLKYLEPMKHLPDRFSNLAFWRGCRKFKDSVVNAFEYVDSWGESIEHDINSLKHVKISTYRSPFLDGEKLDHTMTLAFDNEDKTCSLSIQSVELSKKSNQIIIPLGIAFTIMLDESTQGDGVSLPFDWCPITSASDTSIEYGYVSTITVPCYSRHATPFKSKYFYIYGYILEYEA